jgi:tRNA (guanine37-N1)-methyltransferase
VFSRYAADVKFTIITLFPQLVEPWTKEAIIHRGVQKGLLEFDVRDIRSVTTDKHRTVDDTPYGGGAGMVMRVDVIARALEGLNADEIVMLTPAGKPFTQAVALELSSRSHVALLCGRYEGFDARVESLVTREISIGDFVMMGGEAAAVCVIEAVSRLVPGVLGDEDSHRADSFSSALSDGSGSSGLLDYPEYTRPPVWNDMTVPEVLKGGNHAAVARWRRQEALKRTLERRPDLLPNAGLSVTDLRDLLDWGVKPETIQSWGLELPPPPKVKRER